MPHRAISQHKHELKKFNHIYNVSLFHVFRGERLIFKYLGSYISSSKKVFKIRKAQAWVACNKLHTIWTFVLASQPKQK